MDLIVCDQMKSDKAGLDNRNLDQQQAGRNNCLVLQQWYGFSVDSGIVSSVRLKYMINNAKFNSRYRLRPILDYEISDIFTILKK